MSIMMVFLAPPPLPLGFLLLPPLGLLLFVWTMLHGLHCIFKLATNISHYLDHFHYLAIFYMQLLPMNIGLICLAPIDIFLSELNRSYNCGLLIRLVANCPHELITSCSRNLGQTSISLWHRLCIPSCYFLMPNIPL